MFNARSKADIIATLRFLGVDRDLDALLKPDCLHQLVYRIQNLLPEECGICNESYVVKIADPCLLSCSVCGHEAHHKCYQPLLQAANNEEIALIKKSLGAPGFHFLCHSCEEDHIPDTEVNNVKEGNTNSTKGDKLDTGNDGTIKEILQVSDNKNTIPSTSHSKVVKPPAPISVQVVVKDKKADPHIQPEEKSSTKPKEKDEEDKTDQEGKPPTTQICRHYKNNQCRFGISGKDCPFLHPKRCKKLMDHGTRAGKGCNLGSKCEAFHPKMCPMSIRRDQINC